MASYQNYLPKTNIGEWVRPSDWLALPTVTVAEQKFVGLHAIFPEGNNFCAFLFRGAYTVDWGDGVVENVADNVKAEHVYDYSAISNATLTSRGYKQVIVTVTPQVGQNLTTINFSQAYTGQNQSYATGWLDVTGSFPNAGSGQSIVWGGVVGTTVSHRYVERFTLLNVGLFSNCSLMFRFCSSLQVVPLFDTSLVTITERMFESCVSLRNVPLFDFSLVSNANLAFSNCRSLITVPLFNFTSSLSSLTSMFASCDSLQSIPLFNTASATIMSTMLSNCPSLHSIPALSTASITTTAGSDFGANFAVNNNSLDRCQMVFARTVGFANCQLGVDALVEIFTNLVDRSATTSATITITNNWGAALLTTTQRNIAISKNWLITG
jgi:surface protein